jgi:hypothetical protein
MTNTDFTIEMTLATHKVPTTPVVLRITHELPMVGYRVEAQTNGVGIGPSVLSRAARDLTEAEDIMAEFHKHYLRHASERVIRLTDRGQTAVIRVR